MTLGTIGLGYLAIGAAIAIAAAASRRVASAGDAILLVGMWPLWAPLTFARPAHAARESAGARRRGR